MEQELVSGTIAAVVFENPENGYAVVKLDSDDGGLITVVGTIPAPAAGERLIVTGKWTAHATYGRQLEAEFLERLLPDSTAEICAYLSSRAVRGVGPKTAEKIVAAFGTDSLKILETAPERLTEIDGISRKKALEIGASFRQQVAVRRLIEFLAGLPYPSAGRRAAVPRLRCAVARARAGGPLPAGAAAVRRRLRRSRSACAGARALTATMLAASKRALSLSCAIISQTDIPFSRRTSSLRQRLSC